MLRKFAPLVVALLFVSSCGHPPVTLSPTGAKYWQANRGVVAIGSIQATAIKLNDVQSCEPAPCHPLLSDANTRLVVDASRDARLTMQAAPEGWKAAITTAIDRIESRLNAAGKTELAAYLSAARTIVTSF